MILSMVLIDMQTWLDSNFLLCSEHSWSKCILQQEVPQSQGEGFRGIIQIEIHQV
jgi:hypothetical protein